MDIFEEFVKTRYSYVAPDFKEALRIGYIAGMKEAAQLAYKCGHPACSTEFNETCIEVGTVIEVAANKLNVEPVAKLRA